MFQILTIFPPPINLISSTCCWKAIWFIVFCFLLLDCMSLEINFDTTIQLLDPIDPQFVGEIKTFEVQNVLSICKKNWVWKICKIFNLCFSEISYKWKLSSISLSGICRRSIDVQNFGRISWLRARSNRDNNHHFCVVCLRWRTKASCLSCWHQCSEQLLSHFQCWKLRNFYSDTSSARSRCDNFPFGENFKTFQEV